MIPIEKQVCDKEYAKFFKDAGVKQDSLWYWVGSTFSSYEGEHAWCVDNEFRLYNFIPNKDIDILDYEYEQKNNLTTFHCTTRDEIEEISNKEKEIISSIPYYSAYTVAELGEILPQLDNKDYNFITTKGDDGWQVRYISEKDGIFSDFKDTEANARASILKYLIEQKLIKVVDIKVEDIS